MICSERLILGSTNSTAKVVKPLKLRLLVIGQLLYMVSLVLRVKGKLLFRSLIEQLTLNLKLH
jgi:hypothetical protein